MKKIIGILVFALLLSAASPGFAKVVDKIIAVVNGNVITQAEVDRILMPIYNQYKAIYRTEEELYTELDKVRLKVLRQLIDDSIILDEAKKMNIVIKDDELDIKLKALKKSLNADGMTLKNLLHEQNLPLSDLREKYRDQAMIEKAVEVNVKGRVSIQPSEASNYYYKHIVDYTQPEQAAVYSILIKKDGVRILEDSRKLANDIHAMLSDGHDIKDLAANYSEGPYKEEKGDMGYISRGQLLKEADEAIFSLKIGEISKVIESPVGFHIFMAYDVRKESVLPFHEVQHKVTETLYRTKVQKRFEDWLEKLKSDAYISIK